tara:strand:+ start:447 stop:578 length:132 start_codon:yes stop_codon:yes gene_type:complete
LVWEAFYEVVITDTLTLTPAVFVVERDGLEDVSGALLKTTFKF